MATVNKISLTNAESEMEEGEIVDEIDDLSDISSEEEFLLRQRLEVLENYNNVLERKKAKRTTTGSGQRSRAVLCDLSDISTAEFEESPQKGVKIVKYDINQIRNKYIRPRRRPIIEANDENLCNKKKREYKRKTRTKKKLEVKVISESSEESEDEYRNKRKKLADAVKVNRGTEKKTDTTSLSARLKKMLHSHTFLPVIEKNTIEEKPQIIELEILPVEQEVSNNLNAREITPIPPIEISTDDDSKPASTEKQTEINVVIEKDSDDDLELLRQHALNTKTAKQTKQNENTEKEVQEENKINSEDEDSDTAELRLICLKSALLKKAIEMKQKQKLQKRLSQSTSLDDDLFNDCNMFSTKEDSDNNTDIESVDMEIVSDGEDKQKEIDDNQKRKNDEFKLDDYSNDTAKSNNHTAKEDELEEDEDLLRAKLLTSLSKNLPNLVSPEVLKRIQSPEILKTEGKIDIKDKVDNNKVPEVSSPSNNVPEEKRFIIKLDETDSEGEHEATKNLTKMHIKLSEQVDFQQKLDMFLKNTRQEVEKAKLPDVVQPQPATKKPQKYVAKAVNHLPKSEQIEYKNLVRRMAELEKMKQTRQAAMNMVNNIPFKDMLKPRNVTIDTTQMNNELETQISLSRKKIAEESAKMLKLKEEATKLSQRYKIAATELRNITTAITLNKKQQRSVQNCLAKIRLQHQSLLKSSTKSLHSKVNRIPNLSNLSTKVVAANKLQKENFPKDEYKNPIAQKTVKVSVVNNLKETKSDTLVNTSTRLSIQIDVANNSKKIIEVPNNGRDRKVSSEGTELKIETQNNNLNDEEEKLKFNDELKSQESKINSTSDYKSPLDALGVTTWKADPNAILCPFEVGGQCKDPDCKYLHTQTL